MIFKNAYVLRFESEVDITTAKFEQIIKSMAFIPCPPSFKKSCGFVQYLKGRDIYTREESYEYPYVNVVSNLPGRLICLQIEEKILPAEAITSELDRRVKKIESENAYKVSSKFKKDIRQEIEQELTIKALSKTKQVCAYLDPSLNMLIINTASTSVVEMFTMLLNRADVKLYPMDTPGILKFLTGVAISNSEHDLFTPCGKCTLVDRSEVKNIIKVDFSNPIQPKGIVPSLISDDGYIVNRMQICYDNNMVFTLCDNMIIKGIKYTDIDEVDDKHYTDQAVEDSPFIGFYISISSICEVIKELKKIICTDHLIAHLPGEINHD